MFNVFMPIYIVANVCVFRGTIMLLHVMVKKITFYGQAVTTVTPLSITKYLNQIIMPQR